LHRKNLELKAEETGSFIFPKTGSSGGYSRA
jgi:hypothetical protein